MHLWNLGAGLVFHGVFSTPVNGYSPCTRTVHFIDKMFTILVRFMCPFINK
jgi:hypothetical protein